MQRYSLGIQNFAILREQNCVYVDKTQYIYNLITQLKCVFLSHPRRFGKSLLVSTLEYLFQGRQDLFKGLWIEDKIAWAEHPVLTFSFAKSDFHNMDFKDYLNMKIEAHAQRFGVILKSTTISSKIEELIIELSERYQKGVVLLIDEYDKPITEFLRKDDLAEADRNRETMRLFYSPLKDLDKHLSFLFLTGVSKFSKVSIFSDLNHLKDITTSFQYATLLGYTEAEITQHFQERIQEIANLRNLTYEQCFEKMRLWYNGYSWNNGNNKVYNPTSLLNFLQDMEFNNYWFETGTPTFLIELLKNRLSYNLETIDVSSKRLGSFMIENIDEVTLLYQTGYLTIQNKEDDDIYTLGYPNKEVRDSMNHYLLADYTHQQDLKPAVRDIYRSLEKRDFNKLFEILNSMFGEIPYQIFDAKQEKYYHAIIFLTFKLLGYYAQAEPSTNKGRIDVVVETKDAVFIFEFKVNGTLEEAKAQIHKNQYYQRYEASGKEIYLLAVVCANKEIKDHKIEQWKGNL